MRADRLISLTLLIQRSGPLTAQEIGDRFGISTRTVYRDMDTLGRIGVPVVAVSGPHGGYRILDGYRNEFARLSDEETNALLAAASHHGLDPIGGGPIVQSALAKLAAQRGIAALRPRVDPEAVLIDDSSWNLEPDTGVLQGLNRAIGENRVVSLSIASSFFLRGPAEVVTLPLGLVNKMNGWYLVHGNKPTAVTDVDRIVAVVPTERRQAAPPGFRLREFWDDWSSAPSRGQFRVVLAVSTADQDSVRRYLEGGSVMNLRRAAPGAAAGDNGTMECRFDSFDDARSRILGLGSAARILEPIALSLAVLDYARQAIMANAGDAHG